MGEITFSGDDIEEVGRLADEVRQAGRFAEHDLLEAFSKVVDVKESVDELTDEDTTERKGTIRKHAHYDSVSAELELLKEHGFVETEGKSWRYIGE